MLTIVDYASYAESAVAEPSTNLRLTMIRELGCCMSTIVDCVFPELKYSHVMLLLAVTRWCCMLTIVDYASYAESTVAGPGILCVNYY
jgi:hypothetical protein